VSSAGSSSTLPYDGPEVLACQTQTLNRRSKIASDRGDWPAAWKQGASQKRFPKGRLSSTGGDGRGRWWIGSALASIRCLCLLGRPALLRAGHRCLAMMETGLLNILLHPPLQCRVRADASAIEERCWSA
jgi:hypothetical protein